MSNPITKKGKTLRIMQKNKTSLLPKVYEYEATSPRTVSGGRSCEQNEHTTQVEHYSNWSMLAYTLTVEAPTAVSLATPTTSAGFHKTLFRYTGIPITSPP